MYMLMMGISPIVWGPLSEVYGRRLVSSAVSLHVLFPDVSTETDCVLAD
jgi:MFS family permease